MLGKRKQKKVNEKQERNTRKKVAGDQNGKWLIGDRTSKTCQIAKC